jgi:hypothetical protein
MATFIPHEILAFFEADPIGPILSVARHVTDPTSPIHAELNTFLSAIPKANVLKTCDDARFRFFAEGTSDRDRAARIWIAERLLADEIPRRKLRTLHQEVSLLRPRPYNLPALTDLEVDEDHLVALSEFEFDGARLLRDGYAFLIVTTTDSPNSTYWLLRAIYSEGLADRTRVRLDPFLLGPDTTFPAMFYKMWMYGRPLDWERLASLKQPEHGQWRPSVLSKRSEFTDFVWSPRDREVHFFCEEIPTLAAGEPQASRYFHAVYSPSCGSIIHLDGALRLYLPHELRARHAQHIRNAGKAGAREKVFRTEGAVPRDSLSVIAQTFFVWNEDVGTYFGSESGGGQAA